MAGVPERGDWDAPWATEKYREVRLQIMKSMDGTTGVDQTMTDDESNVSGNEASVEDDEAVKAEIDGIDMSEFEDRLTVDAVTAITEQREGELAS
jgi:hypothetical protein